MKKTKSLALASVFAAILTVCSQLSIPFPGVPLTLQTAAVALCGFTLDAPLSMIAVAVYLLLGAAGLPVFSSFRGGVQVLIGPAGGFLFGFLPMAFLCGLGEKNTIKRLLFGLSGLAVCHAAGCAQYALVTRTSFFAAWSVASLPYLLKDVLSLVFAFFAVRKIRPVRP